MSHFTRGWATSLRSLGPDVRTSEILAFPTALRAEPGGTEALFDDVLQVTRELIARSPALQAALEAVYLDPAVEPEVRTNAGSRLALARPFALERFVRSAELVIARHALEQTAISIGEGERPTLPTSTYLELLTHPDVIVSALAAVCVSFLCPASDLLEMARARVDRSARYERVALADAVLKAAPWHGVRSDFGGQAGTSPPQLGDLDPVSRAALDLLKADFDWRDARLLARILEALRHYWAAAPLFQEESCEAVRELDDPEQVDLLASLLINCDPANPRVRSATLWLASHPAAVTRLTVLYAMTLDPKPFWPELGPILVAALLDEDGGVAHHALGCFQQNDWLVRENRDALRAIKHGSDRARMDAGLVEEFDRLVR